MAGIAFRRTHLACSTPAAGAIGYRLGRGGYPVGEASADRGRRRRHLLRCHEALAAFVEQTGIPVGESQAGKGSLPYDHPQSVGAIGSTGTTAANTLATEADVVIGIGTRYSDFTSASRTAFNNPDVRFVNINVASVDSVKQGGLWWLPMPARPSRHCPQRWATTR